MEVIGQKISFKMDSAIQQLGELFRNQSSMTENIGNLLQKIGERIQKKQQEGIEQISMKLEIQNQQSPNIGRFFELLLTRIEEKQSKAFENFTSNLQKGVFYSNKNQNPGDILNREKMNKNEQLYNPGMPNFYDMQNYQQNYQQNQNGNMMGSHPNDIYQMSNPGMPFPSNALQQGIHSSINDNMNNELAYSLAQQHRGHRQSKGRNIVDEVHSQNNPQNNYKFRSKETHRMKNKSIQENQNKFSVYKKQLANLEDNKYEDINIPKQKMKKFESSETDNQMSHTQKIERKHHELNRKKSEKKIYDIQKEQIRKHSFRKQREAENQMMANIQFLKNLRGSSNFQNHKKQWKQDTKNIKDTLDQIKQAKKRQLQTLGFSSPTKILESKLGDSAILFSPENGHQSSLLPQIRKSRKKALVHKPAPFSVYTIQKDNEIFVNKFTK